MKNILNEKRRLFELITYESNHTDVLFLIQKLNMCRYYTMYHDKDKWNRDVKDDEGNLIHKQGDLKDPHYHIVVYFDNPRSLNSVCNLFHIEANYVQIYDKGSKEGRLDYRVQYIVHFKSKDEFKYEYDYKSIVTNDCEYEKFFKEETSKTKGDISLIFDFFDTHKDTISYRTFLNYIYDQDLWSTFKANAYVFNKLFDEHNKDVQEEFLKKS